MISLSGGVEVNESLIKVEDKEVFVLDVCSWQERTRGHL